ncbi:MAG: hypothetical protein QM784_05805 [Polyangiaceae bacterium]
MNLLVEEAKWGQTNESSQVRLQDVDSLLARRIGRLKPDARRFMAMLTVAVQPMHRTWIHRALGMDLASASDVEDLLRMRRMLRTVGRDYLEPFHDRLRTAFRATLTETETVELHAALADALEAVGDRNYSRIILSKRDFESEHFATRGSQRGNAQRRSLSTALRRTIVKFSAWARVTKGRFSRSWPRFWSTRAKAWKRRSATCVPPICYLSVVSISGCSPDNN